MKKLDYFLAFFTLWANQSHNVDFVVAHLR